VSKPPEEQPVHELPEALKGRRQLGPKETFCFACNPGVPCFTDCCRDINIMLTPVDVLRMARKVGLSTSEFLDTHTLLPITKELHLPVVMLKMGADDEKRCPFVTDKGCGIYDSRPWSCRMYPVASAMPPARAGVEPEPLYFLSEDDFCKGRTFDTEWTVESWRADQNIEEQESLEAGFRELVSHPWFIGGRALNAKQMEAFFTACYDLDNFRRFVLESSFTSRFVMADSLVEKLKTDDEELLRFAYRWMRFALFGEPTMQTVAEAEGEADGKD
jgi:Fe-S-cluster containining protein